MTKIKPVDWYAKLVQNKFEKLTKEKKWKQAVQFLVDIQLGKDVMGIKYE